MQKLKMSVVETFKYQREMVIEVPDEMSDEALAAILESTEQCVSSAEEFSKDLNGKFGIKVLEKPDSNMGNPYYTEIESDFI